MHGMHGMHGGNYVAMIYAALGLDAAETIDAYLMSGGLPGILRAWPAGMTALAYAEEECEDPASPLFGVPEGALLAEFPAPDMTRRVIEAIAGGDRTHANIAAQAGSRAGVIPSGTLSPVLHRLVAEKHILAVDQPLSIRAGKPMLYRVADTNLRFYLGIGRSAQELIRRGRPVPARTLLRRRWASWRGRAVERVIREALGASHGRFPRVVSVSHIGTVDPIKDVLRPECRCSTRSCDRKSADRRGGVVGAGTERSAHRGWRGKR
jgi:hypothetical protein